MAGVTSWVSWAAEGVKTYPSDGLYSLDVGIEPVNWCCVSYSEATSGATSSFCSSSICCWTGAGAYHSGYPSGVGSTNWCWGSLSPYYILSSSGWSSPFSSIIGWSTVMVFLYLYCTYYCDSSFWSYWIMVGHSTLFGSATVWAVYNKETTSCCSFWRCSWASLWMWFSSAIFIDSSEIGTSSLGECSVLAMIGVSWTIGGGT